MGPSFTAPSLHARRLSCLLRPLLTQRPRALLRNRQAAAAAEVGDQDGGCRQHRFDRLELALKGAPIGRSNRSPMLKLCTGAEHPKDGRSPQRQPRRGRTRKALALVVAPARQPASLSACSTAPSPRPCRLAHHGQVGESPGSLENGLHGRTAHHRGLQGSHQHGHRASCRRGRRARGAADAASGAGGRSPTAACAPRAGRGGVGAHRARQHACSASCPCCGALPAFRSSHRPVYPGLLESTAVPALPHATHRNPC